MIPKTRPVHVKLPINADAKAHLAQAQEGDIEAFHRLFEPFHDALASYLYRLTAHREEAADLLHDTYLKAFEKLSTFKGQSSLKTWAFTIATNLARNRQRVLRRWTEDTKDRGKIMAHEHQEMVQRLWHTHTHDPEGAYYIREHINVCFTCIAKTLPLDEQVALMLKDVYGFRVRDLAAILNRTEAVIKHLLHGGRTSMMRIYDDRCSLVSKRGVCYQCANLNDHLNTPEEAAQQVRNLPLRHPPEEADHQALYALRAQLVSEIDPLQAEGRALQDVFLEVFTAVNEGEEVASTVSPEIL